MTPPDAAGRIAGCLLAGAAGDALGAPIEFMSLDEIRRRFGADGLRNAAGKLEITDDTQMTLFTAEGVLRAKARWDGKGICNVPSVIQGAYLRWLLTQGERPQGDPDNLARDGWLFEQRFLHARRAPGMTCLSGLMSGERGTPDDPFNDSKGCGGVMRVAPIGLAPVDHFDLAVEAAALTHGHPSGYLAAGAFAHIIGRLFAGDSLVVALESALGVLNERPSHDEVTDALAKARELAGLGKGTAEIVETFGAGWMAEEALAIAVYCALVAEDLPSGLLLAVNHSGDSDSTGSLAGNLLGTRLGRDAIRDDWLGRLEGREVIEAIAADLTSAFVDDEPIDTERYPPH